MYLNLISPAELVTLVNSYRLIFLLLDYDGTLVPIAATPADARPAPCLLDLLKNLAGLPGLRVAVVSGRALADLEQLLPLPNLYMAGSHGCEYRLPGCSIIQDPVAVAAKREIRAILPQLQALLAGRRGFLCEDKGLSLSLHYRLAEPGESREVVDQFRRLAQVFLDQGGLELLTGKMVVELRPRGINKGKLVEFFLSRAPEARPIYIGDDVTDEDAFKVLAGLGPTVKVASGPGLSAAAYRFSQQVEVITFLKLLAGARARGSSTKREGLHND